MTQLELFQPTTLMYALTAKLSQLKLHDYAAYWEAKVIRDRVQADVARATFCAKVEGAEFSRLSRH